MKKAYLLFPFLLSGLVACGSGGDDGGQVQVDNPFTGVWTSSSLGKSFKITGDRFQIYQHDSRYCLLEDEFSDVAVADLDEIFEISSDGQYITDPGFNGVYEYHAPSKRFDLSVALPAVCDSPISTIHQPGYRRDPERDLELFWQTFNDFYLSFDLKQIDWNYIYQQGRSAVSPDTDDAELMEVLYQMITPLADAHVHISSDDLGTASVNGKPVMVEILIQEYAQAHDLSMPLPVEHLQGVNDYIFDQLSLRQDIILSYAESEEDIRRAVNDQLVWFMVGDIAYLQINGMMGFSNDIEDSAGELSQLESALEQVMADIQFSKGLIIDVRGNNGGRDFLSMAIASRFVDSKRLVFTKQARDGNDKTELAEVYIEPRGSLQYLKPVVVLTSNSTVSAAEVFTLMMRSLPQVTLIGESTQGALSDALEKSLPNGFKFTLSNEFYYSTEGEWFEHSGIPVDVEVSVFTLQQRLDQKDAGLEAAYLLLAEN